MALNDNQEQMVYNALLDLMRGIGVLNSDTLPSFEMLIHTAQEYAFHLRTEGDYKDKLIQECFNALERRHADDLVDDLKSRYGMED